MSSDKILAPLIWKKLIVWFINLILFIFYIGLLQIIIGFIMGILMGMGILPFLESHHWVWKLVAFVSILIISIMSFFWKTKKYFNLLKKQNLKE